MSIFFYNFFYLFISVLGLLNFDKNLFENNRYLEKLIFISLYSLVIIIFGFTVEMGGDYSLYEINYSNSKNKDLSFLFLKKEFFFNSFAKIFYELDFQFEFFSFCIKIISITCIFIFVYKFSIYKFTILSLFFSYYFFSYTLGFIRQGLAACFFLLVILFWDKLNYKYFFLSILLLSSIHITAITLSLLKLNKKNFIYIIFFLTFFLIIYLFMFGKMNLYGLYDIYVIRREHVSNGFYLRLCLFLPSIFLFYFYYSNFKSEKNFQIFQLIFVYIFPLLILFSFINPTVSDRFLIYFFPFSLIIIDKALIFTHKIYDKLIIFLILLSINFTFLNVWLVFGNNSKFFIPIKNFFLE